METPKQREKRLLRLRLYSRRPDVKQRAKELRALRYKLETEEERAERLQYQSLCWRAMVDAETPEERELRLDKKRKWYQKNKAYLKEYERNRRANESDEQREARLKRQREAQRRHRDKKKGLV